MIIIQRGETVNVSNIDELGAANSQLFRSTVEAALGPGVTNLDIDLASTDFVDCCGLGALIALRKQALKSQAGCSIRVLNASKPVRRLFSLVGADDLLQGESVSGHAEDATVSRIPVSGALSREAQPPTIEVSPALLAVLDASGVMPASGSAA